MAKYRAQASLYLGRGVIVRPGEAFTSDATPGRNWQPIDDEAKAAVAKTFEGRPAPAVARPMPVQIPDNWSQMHWTQRAAIAKQIAGDLAAVEGKTEAQVADDIIKAEVARRAMAPQT